MERLTARGSPHHNSELLHHCAVLQVAKSHSKEATHSIEKKHSSAEYDILLTFGKIAYWHGLWWVPEPICSLGSPAPTHCVNCNHAQNSLLAHAQPQQTAKFLAPGPFLWGGVFCTPVATGLRLGPKWSKIMVQANMISCSNSIAIVWSGFLCSGPTCKLHRFRL